MATNKSVGDNNRKGAVRKRTQLRNQVMGQTDWTKRAGKFIDQKNAPARKKFTSVCRQTVG